jgi:hypothetical protein
MANLFTPVYKKATEVASKQKFAEPDWQKFFHDTCGLSTLYGAKGLDTSKADVPQKVREKIAEAAKAVVHDAKEYAKQAGKVVFEASQNDKSSGKWHERAALIELTRHLYRERKAGAQDVWIYSPAKDYKKPVFDELNGADKAIKRKLAYDDEIFSSDDRQWMCDALFIARKVAMDAQTKLASPNDDTKDVIKRWFIDSKAPDTALAEATKKLADGFKLIAAACNSTTLVFTDYIDWRKKRNLYYGGAVPGGEGGGFPVIYLEGAFTRLTGNSGKLWLCAETIIHEFSHHEVSTEDIKYDSAGLKPKKGFAYASAIKNADSWGYFAIDLAGYLSEGDRKKTLK